MNEKITLPALVGLLSNHSGVSKKQCEDFLRELFNVIVDTVSEGESVRIKGLGSFKIVDVEPRKSVDVNSGQSIEITGHKKIVFVPAKELAEEINQPFSIFESVEIPEGLQDIENVESQENTEPQENIEYENCDANHSSIEVETISNEETQPHNEEAPAVTESNPELELSPNPEIDETSKIMGEDEESKSEELEYWPDNDNNDGRKNSFYKFIIGFLCGMLLTAGIGIAIYNFYPGLLNNVGIIAGNRNSDSESPQSDTPSQNPKVIADQPQDSTLQDESETIDVPTSPSDTKLVYDTISKTRYLTTMAKEHYGNYNLWPYIYEENKSFLGHPDRIKPGTRVVIPPLSKFGVDPSNQDHINKAKQMGVEIYSRY